MKPDYTLLDEATARLGCACLIDEPMSRRTTFRIGGPADRFVTVETTRQLADLLDVLEKAQIPWMVMGNGSDLLVSDLGLRGCVLNLEGEFKNVTLLPDGVTLRAGAGASLAAVCAFAREHSLTGLEFAWGIPGSVGGAVYMDAGAYGGEMRDVLTSVTHLIPAGQVVTVNSAALDLGYRKSRYTGTKDIILYADMRLEKGSGAEIAAKMDDLMGRRKAKQPYDMPSAGSVFKRPKQGYAAALIEQCGLKGRSVGGAQVSEKHAGFIVNTGGATCADVLELIRIIQNEVLEQTGTQLECEVIPIGEQRDVASTELDHR